MDDTISKFNLKINQAHKNYEVAQGSIESAATELESLKGAEKTRIEALNKLRREVEQLAALVAEPVSQPDLSEMNETMVCFTLSSGFLSSSWKK